MKALLKGMLIAAMMFTFVAGVSAAETKEENISFNYGSNTFSVDGTATEGTELTVMLVKGDYTEKDLSSITASEVYYVGQAAAKDSTYSIFADIGVKYDSGAFTPGVYTMVTSGAGMTAKKTKVVIGNAVSATGNSGYLHSGLDGKNVTFGTVTQTLRIDEVDSDGVYMYVGVGSFTVDSSVDFSTIGFHVQKIENDVVSSAYRSLQNLGLESINNIDGTLEVGIMLDYVEDGTEIVAIPYIETATATQEG